MKKPADPGKRIRNSLFWQLIIAFAAITLLAGGGVLVIWRIAWSKDYPSGDFPLRMSRCARKLTNHYDRQGSWDGVDTLIVAYPCGSDRRSGDDNRNVAVLATVDGTIVAAGDAARVGQTLSEREKEHATFVLVDDEPVGLLLKYSFDRPGSPPGDWRRPFVAGIAIVGVSLIVAALLSRRLSRPLVNLTAATQAMAAGDLGVRVFIRRRGEIGTLAAAFNKMAAQVEETILTLRRFVSDAAHEINTPLTALRTSLELASDDEHVNQALNQVERLETLTDGLLNLSRVEANAQTEEYVPADLVPLVERVSELYASRAEQAGLTFDLILPESPVTVLGDEAQLQRALANLLDNAIKFTPQGGAVSLGLARDGEWAELRVEDTGIGIPDDDLPQLFSRFHRGRNTATYPGSGLGLAIVKAIVKGHGGTVSAQNTAQGALFTVRLPVAEAKSVV